MTAGKTKGLFKVALIEPEIPSNTGNIGRTCVATHSLLELVGPLGFSITDKSLKRAGLDYWKKLNYKYYKNYETWLEEQDLQSLCLFSVRGRHSIYDWKFKPSSTLVFGKETKGLPKTLLQDLKNQSIRIPYQGDVRSLNLSNVVSVALFEAIRQVHFLK